MDEMLVLTAVFHPKTERRRELADLLQSFSIKARAEPGCVEYRVHTGDGDDELFLYEVWATRADFERHLQEPYMQTWKANHRELLTGDPEFGSFRFATSPSSFETATLKEKMDYHAPDGAEIRLLLSSERGGLCHCTLPPGQATAAKRHRGVEEIWYVLEGQGEVWRKDSTREEVVAALPGTCLTIPPGTIFQFRSLGDAPLRLVISTMPPWPGAHEAMPAPGRWPETEASQAP